MRSLMGRFAAVILGLAVVTVGIPGVAPRVATAAPRKPIREQLNDAARKHWDAAIALYQRANWDGAAAAFMQAYEISKNPRVLFNVGVTEKNRGRYARAIELFQQELAEGKGILTTDEEDEVHRVISGLEKYVASLEIEVSEPGADVLVDDQKVGVSPLKGPVRVQIGERRVKAIKAGFSEGYETVTVAGGATSKVSLKLAPLVKTSLVTITVVGPPSAIVKIDGREVGTAPYKGQVTVSPEPHLFSADATGYVPATQPAIVREGEALNLTLQLAEDQRKGKLVIRARPEGAVIEIDGRPVGSTSWEGPVDVGSHQIAVKKQGYYTWTYDVDVPKGAERKVSAQLNEDRNTSFVPWLIGTVLVVGAGAAAVYFITRPEDEQPVSGTLPPFTIGTPSLRW